MNKTMTIGAFEAFIARQDWVHEQDIETVDSIDNLQVVGYNHGRNEEIAVTKTHVYGYASMTSTLDGVSIECTDDWQYYAHDADSFEHSEADEQPYSLAGIEVVDEDGDLVDERDLYDMLPAAFKDIDYSNLMAGITETEDIDTDTESDMETITIEIDNAPNLRFKGELIGRASSSPDQATGSWYSGSVGRWTSLRLYKTAGGKYICHSIGHTQWQGEHDRYSGKVCETLDEVRDFFKHGWLAKELYESAGIDDVTDIE